MENVSRLNSLRDAIESLPIDKYEAIDHIRTLLGISAEDFGTLLKLLNKSNYSRVEFGVLTTEVELSKVLNDPLEVKVKIATAEGEVSLRFLFNRQEDDTNKVRRGVM